MRSIFKPLIAAALLTSTAGIAAPSTDSPKQTATPPTVAPMVFYLARGATDSCGPGCSEWIAAEGAIEEGTADRMRAFLKHQTGPKRPIFFYSPGGYVSEALTMGRLMRERGLTAGVARTNIEGCEPKECTEAKKSGRELKAKLNSYAARCASACVYALVGARTREIAPEALLGIHAGESKIIKKLRKGVRVPPHFLATAHKESNRRIARYLVEMGIKPALLEAAEKIPHEDIRILGRNEIARFGIDTRSFVEIAWTFDERAGVAKSISESTPDGADFRTTTLRLVCLGATGQILVGYSRNLTANEGQNLVLLKVSASGKDFRLDPPKTPIVGGDVKILRDQRSQWVPIRFFESAAASDHMVLTEGMLSPHITKISTTGLTAALASLHCGYPSPSPVVGTALTPNQQP